MQGTLEMVWSAATDAEPTGLTQLCIYLAADRQAADIKADVEGWLQQKEQLGFWHGAAVTVVEVSSELLHLLFYMPSTAHENLVGIVHEMKALDEDERCLSFKKDVVDFRPLDAMKAMLKSQKLEPDDWVLSTRDRGSQVDVRLSSGKHCAKAAEHPMVCMPDPTTAHLNFCVADQCC